MIGMDPQTESLPSKAVHWVKKIADICKPDDIYWCDGSSKEYGELCNQL